MTRLHAADTLIDLATDEGPVGGWARDRLALWYPDVAAHTPVSSRFAGLSGAAGLVHALQHGTNITRCMALMHAGILGALDPNDAPLLTALTQALDRGHPPTTLLAGHALAWMGGLTAKHLPLVVKSGTDKPLIAATVLLARPTDEVARSVVDELDDDGIANLLIRLGAPELMVGSDVPDVERFDQLLTAGARAGGWTDEPELRTALSARQRGSARSRARNVVLSLLEDVPGALAAAVRAIHHSNRSQAIGRLAPVWAAWVYAQHVTSGSAAHRVANEHAWTVPTRLAAARGELEELDPRRNAGSWTLAVLSGDPGHAATAQDHLFASPGLRHREALRLLWSPLAANAPDRVVAALREERDLLIAFQGAGYCGTEEVLQALVDLTVPNFGPITGVYALALLNSGDRAVLPKLRPLMNQLPRTAHRLAAGLFPDL